MVDRVFLVQLKRREEKLRQYLAERKFAGSVFIGARQRLLGIVKELNKLSAQLTSERIPTGGKNGANKIV